MTRPALALALLLLPACLDKEDPEDTAGSLAWYTSCGDPVCNSYSGPFDGVPLCTEEAAGAACAEEGASCDPVNDCNALLVCATEDPKEQEGGCPISLAKYKKDIHYLEPAEREALREAVASVRLATWRYRDAAEAENPRLGFIIDDQPNGSPAVRPDGGTVDLYGYTSMAIAALQVQQEQITALQAQVVALQAELAQLRAGAGQGAPPLAR